MSVLTKEMWIFTLEKARFVSKLAFEGVTFELNNFGKIKLSVWSGIKAAEIWGVDSGPLDSRSVVHAHTQCFHLYLQKYMHVLYQTGSTA